MASRSDTIDGNVDLDELRDVMRQHPVRLAVLFGSAATGETHSQSDLDVAIELEASVEDSSNAYLSLLADLSSAVGRNDVDLSLVSDLKPRVGLAAFSEGVLLIGTGERMETHRTRFQRAVSELERTEPSLRDRFDTVIENVDRALSEQS